MATSLRPRRQPTWEKPIEIVATLWSGGPRLPTGLKSIDEATRGGPQVGKIIVIGGAPGAGKTSLGVQLCHDYHDEKREDGGCVIGIHASDESKAGLLIRWGQQCELHRSDLETGATPEAITAAKATYENEFRDNRLIIFDDGNGTVEHLGELLVEKARVLQRPAVLLVDSAQTVPVDAHTTMESDNPRQRVSLVMEALQKIAKAGVLVFVTSEMNRGWYRGGGMVAVDVLAAFKESGAIEYKCDVAFALATVKDAPDTFTAIFAKNRIGGAKPEFNLHLNRERVRFTEPPGGVSGPRPSASDLNAARTTLQNNPGTRNKDWENAIRVAAKIGSARARVAYQYLIATGEAVNLSPAAKPDLHPEWHWQDPAGSDFVPEDVAKFMADFVASTGDEQ